MLSDIIVSPSPHISRSISTRSIMLDVVIGLIPAMLAAVLYFRGPAVMVIATCVATCMATEWLCNQMRQRAHPAESLGDLSAVVTGVILALSLPPSIPWWVAVIGSVFSIAIGKMVFGGLGANIFNPAMVGRTFLTASFGVLMTTWSVPATIGMDVTTISDSSTIEANTKPTPLARSKRALRTEDQILARQYAQDVDDNLDKAFLGEIGGCLGETSALAILLGGIYLLVRRTITFHIPLAVLVAAFVFSSIVYVVSPDHSISPLSHLCSGALLLGAFFIATDPVTAPLTRRGMWIFGLGVGTLTLLIRVVGEYPEGVMYAVLLMNAVTPLIDRLCKRVPAGGKPHV